MSEDNNTSSSADNESKKYVINMENESLIENNVSLLSELTTVLLPTYRFKPKTKLAKRFEAENEDKTIIFSYATFFEETLAQNLYFFFGPLCLPVIQKICGEKGLRITGFKYGKIIGGDNKRLNNLEFSRWYKFRGHLIICFILVQIQQVKTFPETTVLPFICIYIPMITLFFRGVVIAIKYATIPRRRMRETRKTTRPLSAIWYDLSVFFLFRCPNEALAVEVDRAMWRADLTGEEMLEFADKIPHELMKQIDLRETSPQKTKTEDGKRPSDTDKSSDNKIIETTNKIPLRTVLKYACMTGTKGANGMSAFSKLRGTRSLYLLLPIIYLAVYYQKWWYERSITSYILEAYILIVGLQNIRWNLFANALFFPYIISIVFRSTRLRMNQYFELLLPYGIADSREYDFHQLNNVLSKLPPLTPTNENILIWNNGRRAIQKFGIFFRRRNELFIGIYFALLTVLAIYQFVDLFINPVNTFLPESALIIVFLTIYFIILLLLMIYEGIRLNKSRKLQTAALKTYLVNIKQDVIKQKKDIRTRQRRKLLEEGVLAEHKIAKLEKEASEFHKAVRCIDAEIEAEEATQKAKVMGLTVDVRMLEFVFAIISTTGYVLYEMFIRRSYA